MTFRYSGNTRTKVKKTKTYTGGDTTLPIKGSRSNKGGAVRGQARAKQVHGLNALKKGGAKKPTASGPGPKLPTGKAGGGAKKVARMDDRSGAKFFPKPLKKGGKVKVTGRKKV